MIFTCVDEVRRVRRGCFPRPSRPFSEDIAMRSMRALLPRRPAAGAMARPFSATQMMTRCMSSGTDLEARIDQLEAVIRGQAAQISALEHSVSSAQKRFSVFHYNVLADQVNVKCRWRDHPHSSYPRAVNPVIYPFETIEYTSHD